MGKITITRKEINVPSSVIVEVAGLLLENDISHSIIDADEDADELTIELEYSKSKRDTIHEIEDIIADNSDGNDDEQDDK